MKKIFVLLLILTSALSLRIAFAETSDIPCALITPELPCTLESRDNDELLSTVELTALDYQFIENSNGTVDLILYYAGQKTYDSQGENHNAPCAIEWKLYDSEDFVIRSGASYTNMLAQGDKFKKNQDIISALEPDHYTLRFINKAGNASTTALPVIQVPATSTPKPTEKVQFLTDYEVESLPAKKAYQLRFCLKNVQREMIAANASVKIIIKSAKNEILYENTHQITESDFSMYIQSDNSTLYQAAIDIPVSSINKSSSTINRIYFTVATENLTFAEKYLSLPDLSSSTSKNITSKSSSQTMKLSAQHTVPPNIANASYQLGSNTEEVLAIKKRMQLLGYFVENAELSGNYNSLMQERIRMFQADFGLKQTGLIDKEFLETLYGDSVETLLTLRQATESVKNAEKDYKASCTAYNYTDVARNPNNYKGLRIKATGKVIQVMESTGGHVTLRVQSSKDQVWYVTLTLGSNDTRILENDRVTVYGICQGVTTYETVMGSSVTIPKIEAEYVEIQ